MPVLSPQNFCTFSQAVHYKSEICKIVILYKIPKRRRRRRNSLKCCWLRVTNSSCALLKFRTHHIGASVCFRVCCKKKQYPFFWASFFFIATASISYNSKIFIDLVCVLNPCTRPWSLEIENCRKKLFSNT